MRRSDLRWHSENANIVVKHVVSQAKTPTNRCATTIPRRVGETYTRRPVVFRSPWLVKQQWLIHAAGNNNARGIGDGIQGLLRLAGGNRGVFVANSQI